MQLLLMNILAMKHYKQLYTFRNVNHAFIYITSSYITPSVTHWHMIHCRQPNLEAQAV
jgi:hypothetical protein